MGQAFCYGCRFLITETDKEDPSTIHYKCGHFSNNVIGIISHKTEEFEEPEPATARCYRPEKTRPLQY